MPKRANYARTDLNREAAGWLDQARGVSGLSQTEFASAIAELVGISVTQSTISNYIRLKNAVPAAVMIAAARVSGHPLPNAEVERRFAGLLREFLARLERIEAEVRDLRGAPRPQNAG